MTDQPTTRASDAEPVLARARMVGINVAVGDVERAAAFYTTVLGTPPMRDGASLAFDVGQSVLWLRPRGRPAPGVRDRTADLTLMVSDIADASARLRSSGIEVGEIFRYEVGATADFHDPDGHWLSLYEASPAAMSWPSGVRLSRIVNGRSTAALVYIFLFVPDAEAAYTFYHEELGLSHLECHPCRRGGLEHERGVVKYDAGGVILTTHLVRGDDDSEAGKAVRDPRFLSEVVPVFVADDIRAVTASMASRGIAAAAADGPPYTRMTAFADRFGRPFVVLETSPELLRSPAGRKIEDALSFVS